MAKGKRTGKGHDGRYSAYKTAKQWAVNRRKKLEKQLVLQPENAVQINNALGSIVYRRKTPTVSTHWNATKVRQAKLLKLFRGDFNTDMLSSNEKVSSAALLVQSKFAQLPKLTFDQRFMFSLGVRV